MFKTVLLAGSVLLIFVAFNCSHTHNCMITSDPPGAKIKINSAYYGDTPYLVKWPIQEADSLITIEVTASGYISQIAQATRETQNLYFVLHPEPQEEHTTSTKDNALPLADEFIPYDKPPVQLNEVKYKYPAKAKALKAEGTVWVKALIDKNGKVLDAIIMKNSGTDVGFEDTALKGAYQIKYKPAYSKGSPVAVWVVYPINFRLNH